MPICNEDCFNCKYPDCVKGQKDRNVPESRRMGDKIKTARLKAGLQQQQVAKLIGVSPALLSLWETNSSGVSKKNLEKLRKLFPEL